jgi:hypothetical protein
MSEWISVEDRLPPPWNVIVVWGPNGLALASRSDAASATILDCNKTNGLGQNVDSEATYWMPLPEPPDANP